MTTCRIALLSALWTTTLFCNAADSACQTVPEIKNNDPIIAIQLADQRSDMSGIEPSLLKLQVCLLIERHQLDASRGLRAIARFQNRGSEDVLLGSLKDATFLQVATKDGWPVRAPRPVPGGLVDVPHRPGESRGPTVIRIKAGEGYKLPLDIVRIFPVQLGTTDSHGSNASPTAEVANNTPIPIPGGQYKVRLLTMLIPESKSAHGARALVSQVVEVTLGP